MLSYLTSGVLVSYGSHLPFDYIRFFEEKIDKVVLASLEDPDETIELQKDTEQFVFQIAEFENYKHIIIENAGHDLYMQSPLIGDMVLDFFKGKELNLDRIRLEPIKFE